MTTLSSFQTADTLKEQFLVKEDLEHAFKLQIKAEELQAEVDLKRQQLENELEAPLEEIRDLLGARDRIITDHLQSGELSEGPFYVKETNKPRQVLDVNAFAEKYPDEFDQLWRDIGSSKFKPSKTDASKVLTSYQIENVSKLQGQYSYAVEWDMHAGCER